MTARYRVDYSPNATIELKEIYSYIAQDSAENAKGMVEKIQKAIDGLEDAPFRQVIIKRSKSGNKIRSLPIPPYMVFFRVKEEEFIVEILRIRHGARRPPKRYD